MAERVYRREGDPEGPAEVFFDPARGCAGHLDRNGEFVAHGCPEGFRHGPEGLEPDPDLHHGDTETRRDHGEGAGEPGKEGDEGPVVEAQPASSALEPGPVGVFTDPDAGEGG